MGRKTTTLRMKTLILLFAALVAVMGQATDDGDKPLVRCKRPMCRMFCDLGFQTDDTGCPICKCHTNPCAAIECPKGEACTPQKCLTHPCHTLIAQCAAPEPPKPVEPIEPVPEPKQFPCAMPMCSMMCPYGYANNEHGCMTCKCKPVEPLCQRKRNEMMEEHRAETDPFRTGMRDSMKQQREGLEAMGKSLMMLAAPQCDSTGHFVPRQCNPMKKMCWCVDDRGTLIDGTEKEVDEYDEEEDLPQCIGNHTTAIHMKFKMNHDIPKEDIHKHIPNIQDAVHIHLSQWMMVKREFIVIMKVTPDTIEEHVLVIEFLVETDGSVDLASAAHGMHQAMFKGQFDMSFEGHTLKPHPESISMEHKFDKPLLPAGGLTEKDSVWKSGCHRFRKFYRHHRVATIVACVGGLFILGSIIFVVMAQCCKKRRSAAMQFKHKRLEAMENFKQNLVLDWGNNHPDLVDEKKKPLDSDEPILISSVNLEDNPDKSSVA